MKLFTIEEANQLIPQVRRILHKIRSHYSEIAANRAEAKKAALAAQMGGGGMESGSIYVSALYKIGELTTKLDSLGVQLKDYESGLVDFPSMRDDRLILLCWKLGEPEEIQFWHEIDGGFAGRKPI